MLELLRLTWAATKKGGHSIHEYHSQILDGVSGIEYQPSNEKIPLKMMLFSFIESYPAFWYESPLPEYKKYPLSITMAYGTYGTMVEMMWNFAISLCKSWFLKGVCDLRRMGWIMQHVQDGFLVRHSAPGFPGFVVALQPVTNSADFGTFRWICHSHGWEPQ